MALLGERSEQQTRRSFELLERSGTTQPPELLNIERDANQRGGFQGDQRGPRHRIPRVRETEVAEHRVEVVHLLDARHGCGPLDHDVVASGRLAIREQSCQQLDGVAGLSRPRIYVRRDGVAVKQRRVETCIKQVNTSDVTAVPASAVKK